MCTDPRNGNLTKAECCCTNGEAWGATRDMCMLCPKPGDGNSLPLALFSLPLFFFAVCNAETSVGRGIYVCVCVCLLACMYMCIHAYVYCEQVCDVWMKFFICFVFCFVFVAYVFLYVNFFQLWLGMSSVTSSFQKVSLKHQT